MKSYSIPKIISLEMPDFELCLTQSGAGIIPVCNDNCGEATLGFHCGGKGIGSENPEINTENYIISGFYVLAETPGYDCNQAFTSTNIGGGSVPFPCTIYVNGSPASIVSASCVGDQIPGCNSLAIWQLACNMPAGMGYCSSSMEVAISCEGGNSTSCDYQL